MIGVLDSRRELARGHSALLPGQLEQLHRFGSRCVVHHQVLAHIMVVGMLDVTDHVDALDQLVDLEDVGDGRVFGSPIRILEHPLQCVDGSMEQGGHVAIDLVEMFSLESCVEPSNSGVLMWYLTARAVQPILRATRSALQPSKSNRAMVWR